MSLDAMLAAHGEAALEALASKGLVRRARRDFEAGKAAVTARDGGGATVAADGQTVQIDGNGPLAAQCDCPAMGLCRHILLAVLALQAEAPVDAAGMRAAEEIAALSEAELSGYAGAEWQAALSLAHAGGEVVEDGPTATVALSERPATVTFIPRQGLNGAALKGPEGKRRSIVAAAALILRASRSMALPAADPAVGKAFDPDFCDAVAEALEAALASVLTGAAEMAQDLLFDLAISARAEAAPRLAGHLRALAAEATKAATRDVGFDPADFLAEAARTYALAAAIRSAPGDTALTGAKARDYAEAPALTLWLLGASKWRTAAGARGVTAYGFAPENGRWFSTGVARGAGVDLAFVPEAAYRGALWGAGAMNALIGQKLALPAPRVAADGQIAQSLDQPASRLPEPLTADTVAKMAVRDWGALRADLADRMGVGLRRRASPLPALIAPARLSFAAFDEMAQRYEIWAHDAAGDRIRLVAQPRDEDWMCSLKDAISGLVALLVEARAGEEGMVLRPVSLLRAEGASMRVLNLDFDKLLERDRCRPLLAQLRDALPCTETADAAPPDPLSALPHRAMEALVDLAAGGLRAEARQLLAQLESTGLLCLAASLQQTLANPVPAAILRTAYLAAETKTVIAQP